MSFCRNCGKELTNAEVYCSKCGTKVDGFTFSDIATSVKRSATQLSGKGEQFQSGTQNDVNGTTKSLLIASSVLFILNFLLIFCDNIQVSFLFVSESGSIIKICKLIDDFGALGDYKFLIPLFTISVILILASAILTTVSLLRGSIHNKSFLVVNLISSFIACAIYIAIAISLAGTEYYDSIKLTAVGYLYIIESLCTFICTIFLTINLSDQSNSSEPIEPFECAGCERIIARGNHNTIVDGNGNTWSYCDDCYNDIIESNNQIIS